MNNKTKLYIANSLLLYNNLFKTINENLEVEGFYIGHHKYDDRYNNHIFLKINQVKGSFDPIKELEGYEMYYPYEDYYVLVFKCPIKGLVEKFVQGKYSEMYSREQLNNLFRKRNVMTPLKVLSQSGLLKRELEEALDVDLDDGAELDSPPNLIDELIHN